jgi:hypothetical protein
MVITITMEIMIFLNITITSLSSLLGYELLHHIPTCTLHTGGPCPQGFAGFAGETVATVGISKVAVSIDRIMQLQ